MRRALCLTALKDLLRVIAMVILTVVFFPLVTVQRGAGYEGFAPYFIDYDQTGIDITSEGP